MKSKTSLISIAIILSVSLIASMTAYAHSDNMQMSSSSTQSIMPMKGGMGMGGMFARCQNMMKTHEYQPAATATTKTTDTSEQVQ